jgi:hypothetical protein
MCAQCVEQIFMPLDLAFTCHGSPSKMMYCIHNVYECQCQLHTIFLKGNKLCSPFHIWPPCYNKVQLSKMGE